MLVVWLDAATEDTYKAVHGIDGYAKAVEAMAALDYGRRQRRQLEAPDRSRHDEGHANCA